MTSTGFGWVKYNDKIYEHDVLITVSGQVVPRNETELKRKYGTSHAVDSSEIEFLMREKPKVIVFGTGQTGCARLSSAAKDVILKNMLTRVIEGSSPDAVKKFDQLRAREATAAIIHVTC